MNAFYGCTSLIDINLSFFDTSNVEKMNGIFGNCKQLTSLNLSNFNTDKVKNFNAMFSGCSSLVYLDIRNFNSINLDENTIMFYEVAENGTIIYNSTIFDGDYLNLSLINWELVDVNGED